jgi:hypothetical protein
VIKKIKAFWQSLWVDVDRRVRLGRILGLIFVTVGFVMIAKAWDGAASINFPTGQLPYLLSGGFLGLAFVVTGCVLLMLSTIRAERQVMTELFENMARLLGRNLARMQFSSNGASVDGQVVATMSTYHRAECKVLVGKKGLTTVTIQQAQAEGLEACRVCDPPVPAASQEEPVTAGSGTPAP